MLSLLSGWVACAVTFLALDAIWLSQMSSRLYRPAIGELLAPKPNLGAAAAFYVMYVTGVLVLAVLPALKEGGLGRALWQGALIGAMAYGTYDLTNQATLRMWSTKLTLADMAWGTILTALAAGAGYLAASRVAGP